MGIRVAGTSVIAGVDGDITLDGTASAAGGLWSMGVEVSGGDVDTSGNGNIIITGVADGSGDDSYGVEVQNATISTVDGDITIDGTSLSSGVNDYGVTFINVGEVVSTGAGEISITGAGGAADINADNSAHLIGDAGATGDITLTANTIDLTAMTARTTSDITVETRTAATPIGLGGGAGTLNLTDTELGFFTAGGNLIFGRADGTGTMTIGAYNAWNGPVQFLADPTGSIVVSGAQTATAASNASFTFSGPTTLGANVSTVGATGGTQDISFSDDVTLTANAQVLAGSGDLGFVGTIDGAFDLTLSAAGTITLSDDIGAGTPLDDLTITSDADPTIGGAVEGTGILTLQQASNVTTMGVAGGAGALNYSAADLAGLGANWTSIRLGSTTATGALTVGARAWDLPVDYRAAARRRRWRRAIPYSPSAARQRSTRRSISPTPPAARRPSPSTARPRSTPISPRTAAMSLSTIR